ncbi:MAG: hypothetical protein KAR35_08000, partial [Candidatus Heimdallarchaeota archaeon]|nr:hypothetical protein [Candidatus Heimdallarchaeota archaeon]MCK5049301.1 hypothetical protein [Candidatus Heimdallarchaeota archaeon]
MSVILVMGITGIYSHSLSSIQEEIINHPLDITINVEGANLTSFEKLLPIFDNYDLNRVDYFSRSQFFLPIDQENMNYYQEYPQLNLSGNNLAPLHCLIIPETLQSYFDIDFQATDIAFSSNFMQQFNTSKGDSLSLWTQLLSNSFLPKEADLIVKKGLNQDNTSLNDIFTLTPIISREPVIWFNETINIIFGEELNPSNDYFYADNLFNTSDLSSLGFEKNHYGQLNQLLEAEANEAFYIMMGTEYLQTRVWFDNLTSFTFVIDVDANIFQPNYANTVEVLKELESNVYLDLIAKANELEIDVIIDITNHAIIDLEIVLEHVSEKYEHM